MLSDEFEPASVYPIKRELNRNKVDATQRISNIIHHSQRIISGDVLK